MKGTCSKCGNTDNYNFTINNGLCDICIEEELDLIEQLQTELDKHRWIPVSERPILKDGKQYLVCNMRQGGVKRIINWNTIHNQWESYSTPISPPQDTHWQPITLPQETT